jgi:transglutaminase-like putative cysteine protease
MTGARFLLRPNALAAVRLVPTLAAGLILIVEAATTQLPAVARGFAIALLVISVIVAFLPKRNDVKTHGSITAAIIAVAAAGQGRTGGPFAVGACLFAILVIVCLRAPLVAARLRAAEPSEGGRLRAAPAPTPRLAALAVLALVTVVVGGMLVYTLPRLSAVVERQIQRMAGNVQSDEDQIGFSEHIRVGALRHALQSNRVVMRIDGEPVDYLRGAVLDRYELRVWSSTQSSNLVIVPAATPAEQSTTHIELSRAALSGHTPEPRWYVPNDACNLHTPSGQAAIDPLGALHPEPANNARDVSFARPGHGSCSAALPLPAAPNPNDLGVAQKIRGDLLRIARQWTRGTTTPKEALDAIVRELARYPYSLDDRQESRTDPVLEFLQSRHGGHCELFASAMALLARTLEIPTRLAVGYRVDEVNTITGMMVVRDHNAHTWVEAWVDGNWQSFDPTPPGELHARTRPTRWDEVGEALSFGWDRSIGFLADISLARAGISFGVLAVALLLLRRFLQRRKTTTERRTAASRPLPAFETLATALAHAGWERTPSEPLERFARRVDAAGEPWSKDVADVLTRYAELRYGGIGEERSVAQRLDELARKVAPA